jgi:hypothetical protein
MTKYATGSKIWAKITHSERFASPLSRLSRFILNGVSSLRFTSSASPHSPCSRASSISCKGLNPMASIPGLRR